MGKKSWLGLAGCFAALGVVIGCGGGGGGELGGSGGSGGSGGGGGARQETGTARVDVNAATGAVTVTPLGLDAGNPQSRSLYAGSAIGVSSTALSTDASELTLKRLTLTFRNNTMDAISGSWVIVDKVVTDTGSLDLREFSSVSTIVGPGTGSGDGPGPSVTISQPTGLVRDADGSVYLAGSADGTIRRLKDGFVTRLASSISTPGGVAVLVGSVFAVEQSAHNLIRVPATGGSKFVMAGGGASGLVDGAGATARFNAPRDIQIIGTTGFISDFGNDRIRSATNLGGGSATVATLNVFPIITGPSGLGHLSAGGIEWLVVTSSSTHKVHLVNSANGQSFVIAGTGSAGNADGAGSAATFSTPFDATVSGGAIFISDLGNRTIRQLSLTEGALPQFASSWTVKTVAGAGPSGSADGPGTTAQFASPRFVATDGSGAILVNDLTNNRTRKISAASGVYPITGSGGSGGTVNVSNPDGYVPDPATPVNRKAYFDIGDLSPKGSAGQAVEREIEFVITSGVSTFSFVISLSGTGTSSGVLDAVLNASAPLKGSPNVNMRTLTGTVTSEFVDGSPMAARFSNPYLAHAGGVIYAADFGNNAIRRFDPVSGITTTIAGVVRTGTSMGGRGTTSRLESPIGMWMNEAETEGYVLLFNPDTVMRLSRSASSDPANSNSWTVAIIAGSPGVTGMTNGTGTAARFNNPRGITVDSTGSTIYVADGNNNQIRRLTIAGGQDRNNSDNWTVSLYAGSSIGTGGTVDGPFVVARFSVPAGIAWANDGNLYVTEVGGNCVRRISPSNDVETIAGPTDATDGAIDGIGAMARFGFPNGICVDNSGFAYISDNGNGLLRRLNLSTGEVRTVAGQSNLIEPADGLGSAASFAGIRGPVFVPGKGVYVGDVGTIHLVERIVRNGAP